MHPNLRHVHSRMSKLTGSHSYTNLTRIPWRYTGCAKMNFVRQGFPQLSSDRQTELTEITIHAASRLVNNNNNKGSQTLWWHWFYRSSQISSKFNQFWLNVTHIPPIKLQRLNFWMQTTLVSVAVLWTCRRWSRSYTQYVRRRWRSWDRRSTLSSRRLDTAAQWSWQPHPLDLKPSLTTSATRSSTTATSFVTAEKTSTLTDVQCFILKHSCSTLYSPTRCSYIFWYDSSTVVSEYSYSFLYFGRLSWLVVFWSKVFFAHLVSYSSTCTRTFEHSKHLLITKRFSDIRHSYKYTVSQENRWQILYSVDFKIINRTS